MPTAMHNAHSNEIDEHSLKDGFEHSDLKARLVMIAMAGIGVMMFGAGAIIVLVMQGMDVVHKPMTTFEASPLDTAGPFVEGYDGVVIERDPRKERDKYLAKVKAKLNSYGMVSDQPGMERAHIPIEEAMKRLADGTVAYKKEPQTALVQ
jgi:hypothetical protein